MITAEKRSREIENSSVGWVQERSALGRNGVGAIGLVCERREAIVLIAWQSQHFVAIAKFLMSTRSRDPGSIALSV